MSFVDEKSLFQALGFKLKLHWPVLKICSNEHQYKYFDFILTKNAEISMCITTNHGGL